MYKKNITYTRYIDDITLSGLGKTEILNIEKKIQDKLLNNGLKLNNKKRIFFERKDEKSIHKIIIKKDYFLVRLDYLKKIEDAILVFKLNNKKSSLWDYDEERKIKGMLNYCHGINREQIKKIRFDFFNFCRQKKRKYKKD